MCCWHKVEIQPKAQKNDIKDRIANKNLLFVIWKPEKYINSEILSTGDFRVVIKIIKINNKIISQLMILESNKVRPSINKLLKINSGIALNLGRN